MTRGCPTSLKTIEAVLRNLIEGVPPKTVANRCNVSLQVVWNLKHRYLTEVLIRNSVLIVDPEVGLQKRKDQISNRLKGMWARERARKAKEASEN